LDVRRGSKLYGKKGGGPVNFSKKGRELENNRKVHVKKQKCLKGGGGRPPGGKDFRKGGKQTKGGPLWPQKRWPKGKSP